MKCGFTTFSNARYMDLVQVLVKALADFSKYPVHLFAINCDPSFKFSNLKITRLDVTPDDMCSICFMKFKAAVESDFDLAIMLDADNVPTPRVDELFDMGGDAGKHPLCSPHPGGDPHNNENVQRILKKLNIKVKPQKYVHANYIYSNHTKPFLLECYNIGTRFLKEGFRPIGADETLLNAMLWRDHFKNHLAAPFNPNYKTFNAYINGTLKQNRTYRAYKKAGMEPTYHLIHGCKNRAEAERMWKAMK